VVRAINGNCTTTDTAIVTQVAGPSFTLGADTALCANGSFIAYGPAAPAGFIYSYAWTQNNNPVGVNQQNLTIIGPGTYILTVTQQPGGCIGADTLVVTTGIPAQLDAPDTVYLCPGGTVSITASSTNPPGQTYAWSLPAPNTNLNTVTVNVLGVISVVVYSADSCIAAKLLEILPSPIQNATLGPDLVLCAGSSLNLNLSLPGGQPMPAGTTYLWSTGATSPSITVNAPGNYAVTATLNGCAVVETLVVSPAGLPPVGFLGNDTSLCLNALPVAYNLQAPTLPNVTYAWFLNSIPAGTTGSTYPVTQPGTYVAVATTGTCSISDTVVITFDTLPPAFTLGGQRVLCAGQSITLSAPTGPSGFSGYAWTQDGNPLAETSNQLTLSTPGLYAVTASHPCGTRTSSVVITGGGAPPPAQSVDTTFCVAENVSVVNNGYTAYGPRGYASYSWSNGSTSRILFIPANGDSATEVLTATDSCGGILTVTYTIRFVPGGGLGPMPTAFTPNGDGFNETFGPVGSVLATNYELLVFNRWGQLVFEADQPGEHWNGTFQNNGDRILQQGIYTYRVQVGTCGGGFEARYGQVVLINGEQR
jgi:gliding motility-associated-like protein